jgi:glucokinase
MMANEGLRVIAIDCGGTNLKAAVVNQEGNILVRLGTPTEAYRGMPWVVRDIATIVKKLSQNQEIAGIAIGIAGVINASEGVITQSPNIPESINFPFREELIQALQPAYYPILIENDANAYALGELWKGAGKDLNSFICLTIGTGLGGGIILDRKLWRGEDGSAAEIGHIVLYPEGERCLCGNQGCLEAYVSAIGLQRKVREACVQQQINTQLWEKIKSQPEEITPELLYQAASQGDIFSQKIWFEFGRDLGIALSSLINIFNPEGIILGGGIARAWSFFMPAAKEEVNRRALRLPFNRVKFIKAVLGDEAAILGAAYLAFTDC